MNILFLLTDLSVISAIDKQINSLYKKNAHDLKESSSHSCFKTVSVCNFQRNRATTSSIFFSIALILSLDR